MILCVVLTLPVPPLAVSPACSSLTVAFAFVSFAPAFCIGGSGSGGSSVVVVVFAVFGVGEGVLLWTVVVLVVGICSATSPFALT